MSSGSGPRSSSLSSVGASSGESCRFAGASTPVDAYLEDFLVVHPVGRFVTVQTVGRFLTVDAVGRWIEVEP